MSTEATIKAISAKLTKAKTAINKQEGKGKKSPYKDLEDSVVRDVINDIEEAVSSLVKLLEGGEQLCPKVKVLEEKNRQLEDEMDHQAQKSLKGKLMISSLPNAAIIKTEEELEKEGTSLTTHIQNLVQMKLGVEVPTEDISACHRTSSGLMLRISNFRPGSSFFAVVDAIKSGKNKEVQLFFNFALTRKRASLLYEVRQLKKAGKIHKFFTDFDGQITVKKDANAKKIKLCSKGNKKDYSVWTSTILELRDTLVQV